MSKVAVEQLMRWMWSAFLFFLVAALLGTLLRLAFVVEVPWPPYRNLVHAHSHVAMMGWLFAALYGMIWYYFVPEAKQTKTIYSRLFWAAQGCVLGMLISFPIQGYAAVSIFFTTAHVLLSYWFIWHVSKDTGDLANKNTTSHLFLKAALTFLFLSTIGTWALGPIMIIAKGSKVYYMAVQFFLHFQFMGWFVFAVLAILFRLLEQHGIPYDRPKTKRFFLLMAIACLMTYALAVTWSSPDDWLFWVNSIGVLIQLVAIGYFLLVFVPLRKRAREILNGWTYRLIAITCLAVVLKVLIQTGVVIPYVATISYTVRNFVIGFIHLLMLGLVTVFIFAVIAQICPKLFAKRSSRAGMLFLLAGVVATELMLFAQGAMFWAAQGFVPYYYELIFACSCLIPVGLLLLLPAIRQLRKTD